MTFGGSVKWKLGAVGVVGLLVAGFTVPGAPGRTTVRLVQNMECVKFGAAGGAAAVGDSITVGTSLEGWPMIARDSWFGQAVCDADIPFTYNGGVHTQTTEQIAARLDGVLDRGPKVLVFLVGTNDVYNADFGPASVRRVRDMVAKTEARGVRPVLATLPPVEGKASEVREFNDILEGIAKDEGLTLIDFHSVLADGDTYRAGLTSDGLHPSEAGAALMGELAAPALRDALR